MDAVMVKAVGIEIPGIPGRSDAQELYDFARSADLCNFIPGVLGQQRIIHAVKDTHAKNTRCFVHIVTKKNDQRYSVVNYSVVTDPNTLRHVAADERFLQYLDHYDMNYMLPVYIHCENAPEFFATIVGQPWVDQTEILRRLKK